MINAFTIGHTKSYEQGLLEEPDLNKIGQTATYEGGWVWTTKEAAQKFLDSAEFLKIDWGDDIPRPPENFSVYGLILPNGWAYDVTSLPGKDGVFLLLNDAKIVSLNAK